MLVLEYVMLADHNGFSISSASSPGQEIPHKLAQHFAQPLVATKGKITIFSSLEFEEPLSISATTTCSSSKRGASL